MSDDVEFCPPDIQHVDDTNDTHLPTTLNQSKQPEHCPPEKPSRTSQKPSPLSPNPNGSSSPEHPSNPDKIHELSFNSGTGPSPITPPSSPDPQSPLPAFTSTAARMALATPLTSPSVSSTLVDILIQSEAAGRRHIESAYDAILTSLGVAFAVRPPPLLTAPTVPSATVSLLAEELALRWDIHHEEAATRMALIESFLLSDPLSTHTRHTHSSNSAVLREKAFAAIQRLADLLHAPGTQSGPGPSVSPNSTGNTPCVPSSLPHIPSTSSDTVALSHSFAQARAALQMWDIARTHQNNTGYDVHSHTEHVARFMSFFHPRHSPRDWSCVLADGVSRGGAIHQNIDQMSLDISLSRSPNSNKLSKRHVSARSLVSSTNTQLAHIAAYLSANQL